MEKKGNNRGKRPFEDAPKWYSELIHPVIKMLRMLPDHASVDIVWFRLSPGSRVDQNKPNNYLRPRVPLAPIHHPFYTFESATHCYDSLTD